MSDLPHDVASSVGSRTAIDTLCWLASVRALPDDAELGRERLTNWGERLPTRTIIRMMIAHDFYHAGEINHIRALLQGTDRWPYD